MIDPAIYIERLKAWRDRHAHGCMMVGGTGIDHSFNRGMYQGMLEAEKILLECMKDTEESDDDGS